MKKILFIIPYVPYPLNSGGNQAFFNMVDYIRRQMSVSLLLYPDSDRNEANLEQLKKVWPDVDFYVFTRDMAKPAVRHPFYYKWLGKAKASLTRKMRRQLLANETQDLVRKKSTLWKSMPGLLEPAYMDYHPRCLVCHRCWQNVIRRSGLQSFQPGTGRTSILVAFLPGTDDELACCRPTDGLH